MEEHCPERWRRHDHDWPFLSRVCISNLISTISQVMIPARVLDTVGPSNPRLSISSDYDLYLRIASAYDVTFIKNVLTRWRYLRTSASGSRSNDRPTRPRRDRRVRGSLASREARMALANSSDVSPHDIRRRAGSPIIVVATSKPTGPGPADTSQPCGPSHRPIRGRWCFAPVS